MRKGLKLSGGLRGD